MNESNFSPEIGSVGSVKKNVPPWFDTGIATNETYRVVERTRSGESVVELRNGTVMVLSQSQVNDISWSAAPQYILTYQELVALVQRAAKHGDPKMADYEVYCLIEDKERVGFVDWNEKWKNFEE